MNQTVTINGRNKNPGTYGGNIRATDFEYMSMAMSTFRILSTMRFDQAYSKQQERINSFSPKAHKNIC